MNTWIEGIENALEYIEQNLTEKITIKEVAEKAYMSEFHFRRIFSKICGIPVGEYMRRRRLTLAAQELSGQTAKIIDVAMKYGYDSMDGFTRAFTKFHGVVPSVVRERGATIRDFPPLRISTPPVGGTMMEYKIVEKDSFTIMGRKRVFDAEDSYDKIPKFWDEHWEDGGSKIVSGMYGLCVDFDGRYFDYYIADDYMSGKEVPDGYEIRTLPAGIWAIFPCTSDTLQDTNTKMWIEWLPNCREYKVSGDYNMEMYTSEGYCELWLPLEKV